MEMLQLKRMYLTRFVESATIIVVHDEGVLDATAVIRDRAFRNSRIKWIWNSVVEEIRGDGIVESVIMRNIRTNEDVSLKQTVFSSSSWAQSLRPIFFAGC